MSSPRRRPRIATAAATSPFRARTCSAPSWSGARRRPQRRHVRERAAHEVVTASGGQTCHAFAMVPDDAQVQATKVWVSTSDSWLRHSEDGGRTWHKSDVVDALQERRCCQSVHAEALTVQPTSS